MLDSENGRLDPLSSAQDKLIEWFREYRVSWIECPKHLDCAKCKSVSSCEFQHVVAEFESILREPVVIQPREIIQELQKRLKQLQAKHGREFVVELLQFFDDAQATLKVAILSNLLEEK